MTPEQRRTAVTHGMATAELSERQACRYMGFARSTHRYRRRRPPRVELRARLHALAVLRPRWGYRRLYRLLRREGSAVNKKLVQRVYREEGLAVRRRKRKRVAIPRTPLPLPTTANQRWSMDFVSDALSDGRKFRALTIVDDFTRESPAIEVDTSLPGERVVRGLESLADSRGAQGDRVRQRARVSRRGTGPMGRSSRRGVAIHSAGQAHSERLRRKLQRPTAR